MVTESTLSSPLSKTWGAAKSGRGKERNTPPTSCCWRLPCGTRGDASVEAQSSGEGVRGQRVTKARGQRGESDGPEESERGKATDTRMRTAGAGPSPVRRGQQRSPVNAQAVRRWTPVALAKWAPPLHGTPWRRITGAEPGAVKAASPVLNGGDEETCRTQRALSLSNCLAPASGSS